jgi:hypothetical protein
VGRANTGQDEQFWNVVRDLKWKLDDGKGGPPPDEPEFHHGRRRFRRPRILPVWVSHAVAFVFGGAIVAAGLSTPILVPVVALVGLVVMAGTQYFRHTG